MTAFFAESLRPPGGNEEIGRTEDNKAVRRSMDSLSFDQRLWSWVASGYVTIPCNVSGSDNGNDIELTPKFRPEIGANGYAPLLMFSFVAAIDPTSRSTLAGTANITINVKNDKGPLGALPVYVGTTLAVNSDVVAGTPYLAIYCDAVDSLSLPARMVIK